MSKIDLSELKNKVCVITGGGGVIGSALVEGLAFQGVHCAIIDIDPAVAEKVAKEIEKKTGTKTIGVLGNVLDKQSLLDAKKIVNKTFGKIDILINGAGGNSPKATTADEFIDDSNITQL